MTDQSPPPPEEVHIELAPSPTKVTQRADTREIDRILSLDERGYEVENEARVFGPPGTGKTTWLAGSIRKTAQTRQTGRLLVASFTTTAASEIAGRGLPLQSSQVGTLHSLAWRAIGRPDVVVEQLEDWNRLHPEVAQTVQRVPGSLEDAHALEFQGSTEGDELMAKLDEVRARRRPYETWPVPVQAFYRKWTAFKDATGTVDFTDMIELALQDTDSAPNDPVVGYFDEAQDLTPLELGLVRHWGRRMERVVMAGDDDQAIYYFRGADPTAFITPDIPDDRKWVLGQSYRVPHTVQRAAEAWVRRLKVREPKEYLPRDEEGRVRLGVGMSYQNAEAVVRDVVRTIDGGQTAMVQVTCSYMVDPIKHALKAAGVPFWNPHRTRTDWNPLKASRGSSGADKVLAYLILDERIFGEQARAWTGADVKRWSALVKKQGVFRRGAAAAIAGLPDRTLTFEEVAQLFEDDAQLEQAVEPSLDWLQQNLLASARATAEYPIKVVRKRGPEALLSEPPVKIGTIHSFKGTEADVVYLFPDLSGAGMREWQDVRTRDSIIRQMYVGMTRARHELVVCQQSSAWAVDPTIIARGR